MNRMTVWMMAALALAWTGMGCKPQAPKSEAPAAAAPAEEIVVPVEIALPALGEEAAAPVAIVEPALSDEAAAVVVAKVNGQDITEGEIHKVLGLFKKQMGARVPPDQLETALPRIRERIIEELVMRQIMLAEVAKQGISLSDSEFVEIKNDLAQELPPGTTLETYMAETGTTEAEMREQMAVRKMIMARADAIAKPSDEEIQKFYDENKEGFAQGETVTASHILIKVDPEDDAATKAAKRTRLEDLRQQALGGADFAELAQANSDCPSASAGGDLGSFGKGQMVPEFEDAAFAQPTGSVGEVVETQFGFHLIKVTEHQEAKAIDFNEAKVRIRDILFSQKQQDAVKEYVEDLRTKADVERFDEVLPTEDEASMLQLDVEEETAAMESTVEDATEVAAEARVQEASPAVEEVKKTVEEVGSAIASTVEEIKETMTEVESTVASTAEEVKNTVEEVESAIASTAEEVAEAVETAVGEGKTITAEAIAVAEKTVAEVEEALGGFPAEPQEAPAKAAEETPAE